jgi:hypothetical protein
VRDDVVNRACRDDRTDTTTACIRAALSAAKRRAHANGNRELCKRRDRCTREALQGLDCRKHARSANAERVRAFHAAAERCATACVYVRNRKRASQFDGTNSKRTTATDRFAVCG